MPEVIVTYKNKRTLEALQDFAKYFDYKISSPDFAKEKDKEVTVNGVTMIAADSSVDTDTLTEIFTGKDINPSKLREEAWQRKK